MSRRKRSLIVAVAALTVVSLSFLGSAAKAAAQSGVLSNPDAIAQQQLLPSARTRDVWKQVYKKLPDLPLENKYTSKETGRVDADNTLVNRLLQYHVYTKGRSPNYRLDWKLTVADYLGANEVMQEKAYPGASTLRQNPLEGDRAAIARLNRKQRDALVQSLVSIFNPNGSAPASADTQAPSQPSTAPPTETKPSFSQPKPGDAQLLMP